MLEINCSNARVQLGAQFKFCCCFDVFYVLVLSVSASFFVRFPSIFRPFFVRFSSVHARLFMSVMYFICASIVVPLFVLTFVVLSDFGVIFARDSRHVSLVFVPMFCCHDTHTRYSVVIFGSLGTSKRCACVSLRPFRFDFATVSYMCAPRKDTSNSFR